jgi:hypothetical protein
MPDSSLAGALDTGTERARETTTGSYLCVGKDPEAWASVLEDARDRDVRRC